MEYQATGKYLRVSPRKLRLVVDSIKKLQPQQAILSLGALPHHAAGVLSDVIASALANAKQKQIALENLQFKAIEVMGGPAMKRWRAVSRGQAHAYKKRLSHIRVVLTDSKESQAGSAKGGRR